MYVSLSAFGFMAPIIFFLVAFAFFLHTKTKDNKKIVAVGTQVLADAKCSRCRSFNIASYNPLSEGFESDNILYPCSEHSVTLYT